MNKTQKQAKNIDNIEAQVERWDLFARLVPTVFLIINIILVTIGIIDFEQAFWIGLGLFAVTAVTWWFWTIYTIRHLVKTLNRASKNLAEVREEFKSVNRDLEKFKNDNE
jgi:hypothetical protein